MGNSHSSRNKMREKKIFRHFKKKDSKDERPIQSPSAPPAASAQPVSSTVISPIPVADSGEATGTQSETENHQDQHIPAQSNNTPIHHQFWKKAYEQTRNEHPKLMDDYESFMLCEGTSDSSTDAEHGDRHQKFQQLVIKRMDAVQDAQLKIKTGDKTIVVKDEIRSVLSTIMLFKDSITAAVSAEPHASLAWAGITSFFPFIINAVTQFSHAADGIKYISDLLVRCRVIEETLPSTIENSSACLEKDHELHSQLKDQIVDIYAQILIYQIYLARRCSRNSTKSIFRDALVLDNWEGMLETLQKTEKGINEALQKIDHKTLNTVDKKVDEMKYNLDKILIGIGKIESQIDALAQENALARLREHRVKYAAYNAAIIDGKDTEPTKCHPETRKEILDQIQKWGNGHDNEFIFWLSGMAGTGKSTIARTVAEIFDRRNRLGASFFFSKGKRGRGDAGGLFPTLALELADKIPVLKPHLASVVKDNVNIAEQGLSIQWETLILNPLSALGQSLLTPFVLILVIDALDECKGERHVADIVNVFSKAKQLKQIQLRIFITSRREDHLVTSFSNIPEAKYFNLLIDSDSSMTTEKDIETYMRSKLDGIASKRYSDSGHWPNEEDTKQLLQKSGRLFIAAATACRFLEDTEFPDEKLPTLLGDESSTESPTQVIDAMYLDVLQYGITRTSDSQYLVTLFHNIVGPIILAMERLSPKALEALLHIPLHKIRILLKRLGSVLIVPDNDNAVVEMFHLSFHDFLLDGKRCVDRSFWIDERKTHHSLFKHCLELLSNTLKEDICGLGDSGHLASDVAKDQIEKSLPEAVQYACLYWAMHFEVSGETLSDEDLDQLFTFLKTNFLHWLEALSLMKRMSDSTVAINILNRFTKGHKNQPLGDFIHDARKFILYHRSAIEHAPLQIYSSALIFSPRFSLVRAQYESNVPPWIWTVPVVQDHWSRIEQTFQSEAESHDCMALAPDGKTVAASFGRQTILICNIETGQLEQRLHTSMASVEYMTFTPDSMKLVSVSKACQFLIWNIATGQPEKVTKPHLSSGWLGSITPDFTRAAVCKNQTTEITCTSTGRIETTFNERFSAVKLSPDGTMMASIAGRGVRLHNIGSENAPETFWSATEDFYPDKLFFSDDSSLLVVQGISGIRIWSTTSAVTELEKDWSKKFHSAAALSRDNSRLALSFDSVIEIWNLDKNTFELTVNCDAFIDSLKFSADSKTLISGSFTSMRVIDVSTISALDSWNISEPTYIYDISPDGTTALSRLINGDQAIWNITTGQLIQKLDHIISAGIFSPDSTWLATAERSSEDIHMWELSAGRFRKITTFSSKSHDATFSPDSTRVISYGKNGNICILNLLTQETHNIKSKYRDPYAMSPDNTRLAVLTKDSAGQGRLEIRCTETGSIQHTFMVGSGSIYTSSFIFSHDSQQLAIQISQKGHRKTEIWNVTTGNLREIVSFPSKWVQRLAFSPRSTHIMAGTYEGIYMWNIESKKIQSVPDIHWDAIQSLNFTSDDVLDESPFYTVTGDRRWVTYAGRRILAIPVEFEPDRIVPREDGLVLGNTDGGRAVSITFDTDEVVRSFNIHPH